MSEKTEPTSVQLNYATPAKPERDFHRSTFSLAASFFVIAIVLGYYFFRGHLGFAIVASIGGLFLILCGFGLAVMALIFEVPKWRAIASFVLSLLTAATLLWSLSLPVIRP
jgi:hypothetical protein